MALSGLDMNLLPVLDALLTERSVTRAAERMSVGQPAMSSALARLRKQLGDPLLVREGRMYRLSALAESLVVPVRDLVVAAEDVLGVRKPFDPARAMRRFTIETSDYVAMVLLKPLMVELAAEAPGVLLSVVAAGPGAEERLRRASVDLLICPLQMSALMKDLPRTVLFEDRYVLVGDRDNSDLDDDIDVDRLRELRYVGQPVFTAPQLEAQGILQRRAMNMESHVVIPFLLSGTRFVSLVQERLARAVCEQAHLRIRPCPVPLPPLVEALHWTAPNSDDPAHRWLRSRLVDQAKRGL
jgi:DNA-binding transcriptional LysR family regulator